MTCRTKTNKTRIGVYGHAALITLFTGMASCTDRAANPVVNVRPQQALSQPAKLKLEIMPGTDSQKTFAQFDHRKITSPIAYETPPTPAYSDRPISDALSTSLEAADYVCALRNAGLYPILTDEGPLTVLAPAKAGMESDSRFATRDIFRPENRAKLREALGGTILKGNWDARTIARTMKRKHTQSLTVPTKDGRQVTVTWDAKMSRPVFEGANGQRAALWGGEIKSSNGTLYFTQQVFTPQTPVRQEWRLHLPRF